MISLGPVWGEHWRTREDAVKKGITAVRDRDPGQGGRLGRLAEEETGLPPGKCRPARRLRSVGRQGPFKPNGETASATWWSQDPVAQGEDEGSQSVSLGLEQGDELTSRVLQRTSGSSCRGSSICPGLPAPP